MLYVPSFSHPVLKFILICAKLTYFPLKPTEAFIPIIYMEQ